MRWCGIGFLALLFFVQPCLGLTLVDQGNPVAVLVLPDEPTELEQTIGADMQRILIRMSGATLPIVRESSRPGSTVCVDIGATASGRPLRQRLLADKSLSGEAGVIEISPERGVLIGRNDAGSSHAVYVLLQQLGVRWLQPSLAWEIVPSRKTVSIPERTQRIAPYFERRGGMGDLRPTMDGSWSDSVKTWPRRNRLGGWDHTGAAHTAYDLVPRSLFKEHPEYFGLWKGKRGTRQLCTTHPEVIRRAIEYGLGVCASTDASDQAIMPRKLVCIGPNDGVAGFCECQECSRLRFAPGNHSDLILELANHVARAVRSKYPGRYVTFYADYHNVGAPVKVKPEKNVVFWIPQWGVDRFKPITHPGQKRFHDAIANWSTFGNPIHLYMYYGSYNHWLYYPMAHCMKVDLPYFAKHGVRGLYSETPTHWGSQGLNFYLYARLGWNPALDVDELVTEFCRLAFGPAAETMLKYYRLQQEIVSTTSVFVARASDLAVVFTPERVAELDHLMAKAITQVEQAVSENGDKDLLTRIEYVALAQRMVSLHLRAVHAQAKFWSTRDRDLLALARKNYEEELRIINQPGNEYLVAKGYSFRSDLERDIAAVSSSSETMTYGPGEFSYRDCFAGGGRAAMETVLLEGFVPRQWGLNLYANNRGQAVWRFTARDGCHFEDATLWSANVSGHDNALELRTSRSSTQYVTITKDREVAPHEEFNVGEHVKGASWFEIRYTARNDGALEILSLTAFSIKGRVVKK